MKRYNFSLVFSVLLGLIFASAAFAQSETFNDKNVEYTFDLPEPAWKMTVKPSAANPIVEYVYGDRMDGYFEIRKITVEPNEIMSDVIVREQDQKMQFIPGYISGKEENFSGNYRGNVSNYEFVRRGRKMSGRFYYLKTDPTTVYILRFTGMRDSLRTLRNQTDSIARTFKVKSGM
ncbi:MAG: hypothetical protein ACR2L1_01355 [Pyrinomonadaceae bacterium]